MSLAAKEINIREYMNGDFHLLRDFPPRRKLSSCLKSTQEWSDRQGDIYALNLAIRWMIELRDIAKYGKGGSEELKEKREMTLDSLESNLYSPAPGI